MTDPTNPGGAKKSTDVLLRPEAGSSGCVVRVLEGPDRGVAVELERGQLTIGTEAACDLVLTDSAVSARHLQVEVTDQGLVVRDLNSTNGTFYRGVRLREITLPLGALLTLGRTHLALTTAAETDNTPPGERDRYGEIIGSSAPMQDLYRVLERLERVEFAVLVHGETGVGKELVAREIHNNSPRQGGPYEIFDCAAVSPQLVESELFGHVRGAFTGANRDHTGVFERARGGTVFLDEIGELPLDLQPKLLRALESHQIRPVGADRTVEIDARLIAATNRNLETEVKEGRFRRDLYFRLNVVMVVIPPLREHREDLPALTQHLLRQLGCSEFDLSQATSRLMGEDYDWPGNVRELRNVLTRAISLGSLPKPKREARDLAGSPTIDLDEPLPEARKRLVEAFERDYLSTQMRRCEDNISRAARASGMDRAHFRRLLVRHGLLDS